MLFGIEKERRSVNLPSVEVMDDAAKRLGAKDHKTLLEYAPMSFKGAFKLICELIQKYER